MSSILQQIIAMRTPFNMIVLVVIVSCGAGLVTSLAKQCRKYACHRQELDFKRDMLDRGMTAEEIAQVIETAPQPEDGIERWIASWGRCKKKSKV